MIRFLRALYLTFWNKSYLHQELVVVSSRSSVSSVSFIDSLPTSKQALHDIRFRFRINNIWTVISTNHPDLRPNEVSKDIFLKPIVTHDLTIKTTIHHTDTVSVIVGCSSNPVVADIKGLVRLSNVLTRVEERLLRYIECAPLPLSLSSSFNSDHESWIVTPYRYSSCTIFGFKLYMYCYKRFADTVFK
jgi:hypothetical protein